jgi:hypothetical protein
MKSGVISQGRPIIYIATISHIFAGGRRKISEEHGFWCYLAPWLHNQSNHGVHCKDGHELDLMLKRHCQMAYEKEHSREEFMALIGKNYLDD